MPGITDEWQLPSYSNELTYNIRILDFKRKVDQWGTGREFFYIGESEFSLNIYPKGNERDSRGHISVFLVNRNNWDVKAKAKVNFGSKKIENIFQMDSNSSWGWPKFCEHKDLEYDENTPNLTLSANITLFWEEVNGSRKDPKALMRESRAEVEGLKIEVTDLKRKIETLEINVISKLDALEIPSKKKATIPCPECPICFNDMKPPIRIVQCTSGHLICRQCRDNPEVKCCPTCKQQFTGTAIGMENYLRTIFA